jgi:chorismate mutase/prephenate dehydrogenase
MNEEDRLEQLRRRIRNLDAALLGLVAERIELAREVGREKRSRGVPLRDFEVEKRVLQRAAESATELGVESSLARDLMRSLIDESCRIQEVEHYSAFSGEAESVLVIGGAGKMGRWLVRFLESQGHRVRSFDPAGSPGDPVCAPTLAEGLGGASIVLIAVPLERTATAIDEVVAAGFRGIVCDIASLKQHLQPAFDRACAAGAAVASLHPMFGPGVRTLSGRVVVVCDCGAPAATGRVAGLFRDTAATLIELDLERHDRVAAWVLGLSHLINLVFARALASSGLTATELGVIGSTTYAAQVATTRAVAGENPELYYGIQKLNPFTAEVHGRTAAALADWSNWIGRGDAAAFAAAMSEVRAWLGRGAEVDEGTSEDESLP